MAIDANTAILRLALRRLAVGSTCAVPLWAAAQIYIGPAGPPGSSVVLANHPSDAAPFLFIDAPAPPPITPTAVPAIMGTRSPTITTILRRPGPTTDRLIPSLAREYAVPETLVRAVVAVESGFDPRARSRKGAMGLMQLMPETARRFGVADPYSEEQNLRGGIAYLRWLLDTFAGDVALALAAYNAGESAVVRAGHRIPDYAETRAYVTKVLAYQRRYADAAAHARLP